MSKRLDQEREKRLSPQRFETALKEIEAIVPEVYPNSAIGKIDFMYNGSLVTYWPYSGWASGKSIKDGRGLKNLLKQIDSNE